MENEHYQSQQRNAENQHALFLLLELEVEARLVRLLVSGIPNPGDDHRVPGGPAGVRGIRVLVIGILEETRMGLNEEKNNVQYDEEREWLRVTGPPVQEIVL